MSANLLVDVKSECSNVVSLERPQEATTPMFSISNLSLEDNPWGETSFDATAASANVSKPLGSSTDAQEVWASTDVQGAYHWSRDGASQVENNEPSVQNVSDSDNVWGDVEVLGRRAGQPDLQLSEGGIPKTAWTDTTNFEAPISKATIDSPSDKHSAKTWEDYDDLENLQCEVTQTSSSIEHKSSSASKRWQVERDENVLFDADDDYESTSEDFDDFGNFESAKPANMTKQDLAKGAWQPNLLDLDTDLASTLQPTPEPRLPPSKSGPVDIMDDFEDWEPQEPAHGGDLLSSNVLTPVIAKHTAPEEPWDDFQDWSPTIPNNDQHEQPKQEQDSGPSSRHDVPFPVETFLPTLKLVPGVGSLPPNNIPPPSVLLSLFHPLLSRVSKEFLEPLFKLDATEREQALRHPLVHDVLSSCIAIGTTLAHIIAGRKSRWKRDVPLAQSMRIGPAAASTSRVSGMKLAGVDKTETAKEDREVAEVIRTWKTAIVGRLRTSLAASRLQLHLPDIDPVMAVRIANQGVGLMSAPKPCALCGLKREERVIKSDFKVEDSFGEWWVDHWGHRDCNSFWGSQRSNLATR